MVDAATSLDPARVRELSLARLGDLGVQLVSEVPLLAGDLPPRPVDTVLGRLFSLHACAAAAFGFERVRARGWLEGEGLTAHATDAERAWLAGEAGDAFTFQVGIEAMWALAWAIGLVEELAPDEPCFDDFVLRMPDLREAQGTLALIAAGHLRGVEALADHLDLYRCLHHAALACELGGPALPPDLPMHRIAQRHRALAWVLGEGPWEDAGRVV